MKRMIIAQPNHVHIKYHTKSKCEYTYPHNRMLMVVAGDKSSNFKEYANNCVDSSSRLGYIILFSDVAILRLAINPLIPSTVKD